jgi:hypothetical protein
VLSATVDGNNVKVTWRFRVTTEYANPAELLHGAAQALFGEFGVSWRDVSRLYLSSRDIMLTDCVAVSSQSPGSRCIPRSEVKPV